jgi:drug/metabolite transporter (DMT)-like permease
MPETPEGKPDQHGSEHPLSGLISLLIVYLVWGSTYLAIRVAVREGSGFTPFIMGATRLLAAGGLLLLWSRLRRKRIRLTKKELAVLAVSGGLLWTGANGLVMWAEQHAHSGYAALLMGAVPIWTAVIASFVDRRAPTRLLVTSLVIGFAGLGLLTAPVLRTGTPADWTSAVALLIAPISWASGSLLQQRNRLNVGLLVSAGYQQLFGGIGFVLLVLLFHEPFPNPTLEAWGGWVFLVVLGSLAGFTAYVHALRRLPTNIAMTYAYVNPVIAVIFGWLILREPITPFSLGGMVLVLLGVSGVFHERYGRRLKRR